MTLRLVTGDSPSYALTAKQDGAVFAIDSGATVRARIVDINKNALTDIITLSSATTGADWPNSLIVAQFLKASTELITYYGKGYIELEINDNAELTYFYKLNIEQGTI